MIGECHTTETSFTIDIYILILGLFNTCKHENDTVIEILSNYRNMINTYINWESTARKFQNKNRAVVEDWKIVIEKGGIIR